MPAGASWSRILLEHRIFCKLPLVMSPSVRALVLNRASTFAQDLATRVSRTPDVLGLSTLITIGPDQLSAGRSADGSLRNNRRWNDGPRAQAEVARDSRSPRREGDRGNARRPAGDGPMQEWQIELLELLEDDSHGQEPCTPTVPESPATLIDPESPPKRRRGPECGE